MYRFLELTVGPYMSATIETVRCDTSLGELDLLFRKHDFNAFPVVERGRMVGLVTKFDFLKTFVFTTTQLVPHYDELMQRSVGQVMTQQVTQVEPQTPLTRVLQLMVDLRSRSFPVVDPQKGLVGMIAREDIMHALQEATSGSLAEGSARP